MKLKRTVGFLYRLKSCFSFASRKRLVSALFLSQLDYGDTVYGFASKSTLFKLDPLYHAALRFITKSAYRTHHCTLYSLVGWLSLPLRRLQHWHIFIFKIISGLCPNYLRVLFIPLPSNFNLRSHRFIRYKVPVFTSDYLRSSLSFHGPKSWNDLQDTLRLESLISINAFKQRIKNVVMACTCFGQLS